MINRILCPVDFSDFSRHALEHAAMFARWYGAKLAVLHAHIPSEPALLFTEYVGAAAPEPITPSDQDLRERVLSELTRFAQPIKASGVPLTLDVVLGNPVQAILETAKSLPADFLVMGTHGRGGLDRLVLGSVAEKVLRKVSCPVLTVPPPVSGPAPDVPVLLKRILCTMDFSEWSMKALAYALSLAEEADALLIVLHVLEGLHTENLTAYPDLNVPRFTEHLEADAVARLRAAIPEKARAACQPEELVAKGKPYREILRIARERDVHLIVMGVHGRNPVDMMLFGSTTQHVVRAATCPVLTLRG